MRTLILLSMVISLSAFGQERVRENIKQRTILDTADTEVKKVVKAVVKEARPVKQAKK